jgi:hypothetical protein
VNRLLHKPSTRYLEAMDPHANDDFEVLHKLLSKAKERYHSVRATLVHKVNLTLGKEANRRFINWRFDQSSPGMGIIRKPEPPHREDFNREYGVRRFRRMAPALAPETRPLARGEENPRGSITRVRGLRGHEWSEVDLRTP